MACHHLSTPRERGHRGCLEWQSKKLDLSNWACFHSCVAVYQEIFDVIFWSVSPVGKAYVLSDYILEHDIKVFFITETGLCGRDDPVHKKLTMVDKQIVSFLTH